MSWLTFSLIGAVVVAALFLVLALRLFLRATAGASGLKARVDRLFHLPVRARPVRQDHYFRAYWTTSRRS